MSVKNKAYYLERGEELKLKVNDDMSFLELKELVKNEEQRLEEEKKDELISPYEYFQRVKSRVEVMDNPKLTKLINNAKQLFDKYQVTGQTKAAKRLAFHLKSLLKEEKLLELGINKFVYRNDIENYIENVSKKPVKIIELENYPREIPDEIVETITKTKDLFDKMYVLFTDYSEGQLQKEVEKERDPILFGAFHNKDCSVMIERMYYLGDWEDEFCDLTLDKLVQETSKDIVKEVSLPKNKDKLILQLEAYSEVKDNEYRMERKVKEPFFKRIFNALKGVK